MKKIFTRCSYVAALLVLFLGTALQLHAQAQFSRTNLETGGLYTALAKDTAGNIYVTRVQSGTGGATYEVVKYGKGAGTPVSIYSPLTHETSDYPWGLVVSKNGNTIYISTDFTSGSGSILKLTKSGSTYTSSTYQSGRYFTALAIDTNDNLYTTEYDAAHSTYAVVKYPANSAANTAGTTLYDNLISREGYTYPTGLTVAANGDVYVADAFSNDISITDGGHIYKLKASSSYTVSQVSAGKYSTALAMDVSGNLISSENGGTTYHLIEYPAAGGSPVNLYAPMHTNGIYYPWGIAVVSKDKIFAIDGDDGTLGGAVMKLISTNSTLAGLAISSGTLSPAFASGTTSYTATVANAAASVTFTPTASDALQTIKVNGVATASGSASAAVPLSVGSNSVPIVVTAPDNIAKTTYTVTVTRLGSSNANLSGMHPSTGMLTPGFTGVNTSYTDNVSNATTYITITPTTADANATVTVNGVGVTSGSASANISLNVGPNTISTVVTAQDGTTTKTYTLTVTRAASSNANLYALHPSSGTLNPAFAGTTTSYTASVANPVTSVTITPTAADPTATITVNGTAVNSGSPSGNISLAVGQNTISTVVTAQDGATTKTYTLVITRAPSSNAKLYAMHPSNGTLSPGFTGANTSYTESVPSSTSSITITPTTADAGATVTVNGNTVASGTASPSLPLVVGPNTITTIVTAQDGSTTMTYTITVTRAQSPNSFLSALSTSSGTLSPAFSPTTTSYSVTVDNTVSSITVTPTAQDAGATISVNGYPVQSGTASGPVTLVVGENNQIPVIVTSQDGSTNHSYTLNVTRLLSANAKLTSMHPSNGTLSPAFNGNTTSYTTTVSNAVASITITPVSSDDAASITVNGVPVGSGSASPPISLSVGANAISTVVTAADGTTTKTYTLTVTRTGANNANLSAFHPSNGTLSPSFTPATTSYTASVSNAVSSMTVTPTTADANATVTVNGQAVSSGSASQSIALVAGPNTITTVVTAQDGTTTKTYTLTVNRAPSSNALLAGLHPSNGTLSPSFTPATTSYTASVTNAVSSITVTPKAADATAGITVNGLMVNSGSASQSLALAVGPNTITTVVTAQDGTTTNTYTLTVTRAAPSGDAIVDRPVVVPVKDSTTISTIAASTSSFDDDILLVHQAVSPNGDGLNDVLTIDGILAYPDNKLQIMNRNGELVYTAKGYDNYAKAFDGHSNITGKLQQAGTYFYSLDYTVKGQAKHKTGYIVLKY